MNYFYLLFALTLTTNLWASSFVIELYNTYISVDSPEAEINPVSIVVKNTTTVKVNSELRSVDKVLKRFVVESGDTATFQVKLPKNKRLYYVSVAPASQAVELKFNQRKYAVPEQE